MSKIAFPCALPLIFIAQPVAAIVMTGSAYDVELHGPVGTINRGAANGTKEIRNQAIANQARFQAVGAMVYGTKVGALQQSCTGALINAYTVLTAGHCVRGVSNGKPYDLRSNLEKFSFVTGSDLDHVNNTYRFTAAYLNPSWEANPNPSNAGSDWALLQIYNTGTLGAALETPTTLYSPGDVRALNGFQFPVIVGYGSYGYGSTNIDPQLAPFKTDGRFEGGALNYDEYIRDNYPSSNWYVPPATKRAGLNDRFERFDIRDGFNPFGNAADEPLIITQFDSPGTVIGRGNPSNFNETVTAPGDSGGPMFINTANGWEVIGITSYGAFFDLNNANDIYVKDSAGNDVLFNGYRYDPSVFFADGKRSYHTKITDAIKAEIGLNDFESPGVPYADDQAFYDAIMQMNTASPVSISALLGAEGSTFSLGFDYGFGSGGVLTILIDGKVVDTIAGFGQTGSFNSTFSAADYLPRVNEIYQESRPFGTLELVFDGPAGLSFYLDNLRLGGATIDFSSGFDVLELSDPAKFQRLNGKIADYVANGAVPEPKTWAMLVIGFGIIGQRLRQKKRAIDASTTHSERLPFI